MSYFNRNKWWAVLILLLVALNIATLAAFWLLRDKQAVEKVPSKSPAIEYLVNELGLDSVQKEKLGLLKADHQQKMREIRSRNKAVKDALFSLLKDSTATDSAVAKAARESVVYDVEAELVTFKHFREIRNLCNPEQKKKFDSVIAEVLRMMAPRPGGPNQGPPPERGSLRDNRRDGPPADQNNRPNPPPGDEFGPPDSNFHRPPPRNGDRPPPRNGDRPPPRNGDRPPPPRDGNRPPPPRNG